MVHEHVMNTSFQKTYHGLHLRKVTTFLLYCTLSINKQNNIELSKIFNVPKWESQKFSILLNMNTTMFKVHNFHIWTSSQRLKRFKRQTC